MHIHTPHLTDKTILLIGTYDTKSDELNYLRDCIFRQGGHCISMDVSVLGDPPEACTYSKHAVAAAAGVSIQQVIDSGDENSAMQLMALGAAKLASELCRDGIFNGMLAIGGSMATDLALDVALALPLGIPKYIVSTVAFSAMIPAERLAADVQMLLWAGGLYGLNSVCRASLSQAAGAVLGAARAVELPTQAKPLIGMTSLGKSCLRYMVKLKPALEQRGFEVAVFHATGMGGRAFESLAAQGKFVAVLDLCTQELGNWVHGSVINAGCDRMLNAGKAGIPQIIAPGAVDMVDLPTWLALPEKFKDYDNHVHNRLINSVILNGAQRAEIAELMAERLSYSQAKVHVLLPAQGIEEWDRVDAPLYAPTDHAQFIASFAAALNTQAIPFQRLDCHINDEAFVEAVLEVFDEWVKTGVIVTTAT